jgi:hypothetical protein
MAVTMTEWQTLKYVCRARLCEVLSSWALAICPKGYTPGIVEACVDAYKRRGAFANIDVDGESTEGSKKDG